MPVTLTFRGAVAASAMSLTCFACLQALLKSALRDGCTVTAAGGSNIPAAVSACVASAAISLVAIAVYFFKTRAWSWTLAVSIASKWQSIYFAFLLVQSLVLIALVTYNVRAGRAVLAAPCAQFEHQVQALSWAWLCVNIMTVLSTMSCDLEAAVTPALRRCAYGLLALVLLLDAIGSVMWGNLLAGDISVSVSNVSITLDNQITSCKMSQVMIALHFFYVSCRSKTGRGWAYPSLRYALDECGQAMSMQKKANQISSFAENSVIASAATPMLSLDVSEVTSPVAHAAGAARSGAFLSRCSLLHHRWLELQERRVSRCRVFIIPCIAVVNAGGGSDAAFELARPALDLRCLRPLQKLADGHPRLYVFLGFCFLCVPSIASSIILHGKNAGISTLIFNSLTLIAMLGLMSSRRWGFDRVAAKHVVMSFRFALFVSLFAIDFALSARLVLRGLKHTTQTAANTIGAVNFCISILLECSPQLPSSAQLFISVSQHPRQCRAIICRFTFFQAGWLTIYGIWTYLEITRIAAGLDLHCFINLGAYKICESIQMLSIYSSLSWLMLQVRILFRARIWIVRCETELSRVHLLPVVFAIGKAAERRVHQALITRIMVPGISNFVNASVRSLRSRECGSSACTTLCHD
jgi:hypothetical protein